MVRPPLEYKAYLIDLDGTVYLGKKALPGARETLQTLRELGKRLLFLTNDASQRRERIATKLLQMGIPVLVEEILNPSYIAVQYLRQYHPQSPLLIIGEGDLHQELREAGLVLCNDPKQVQVVLVSTDHRFNYRKLKLAFDAIRRGAVFLATNADRTYPSQNGEEMPDTGAIIAALEACTARHLDVLLGKPATLMAELALEMMGLPAEECLLIGDNPETDIRMGNQAGIPTALVCSGVASHTRPLRPIEEPTYVFSQLGDLLRSEALYSQDA
ncbi:MAG: HAD-IIA family hydrolase [Anaerolineales bacterium]|nr:HAD-IIA family hydrolase [Anaerolineales bacterium]MCS7247908.1 HAD-IIA family hydrolase [Anaerolineales bacterium]MDW8161718.1 HAD-IIA family hydrolase [Anaerolineales bacterium]MDW8447210.1 HAD-IIA family hydrolase [Anaerolineales bacterium]